MYNLKNDKVKTALLIGSAAAVLVGLFAFRKKRLVKNVIVKAAVGGLLKHSALKLLNQAHKVAVKEIHRKT